MFVEITIRNIQLLETFISSMGNSNESFRYYNKRKTDVIKNHLTTVLLVLSGVPVGYGHFDREGEKVWLGIAISEDYRGKGKGKLVMEYLMLQAEKLNLANVYLSVDKKNVNAIELYKKFGFFQINEENDILYLACNLNL